MREAKQGTGLISKWGKRNTSGVTIASSIRFEGVSHAYGERSTLQQVDLEVMPGEVVCLLGPSGSGKTTLLRLAAGLAEPSAGSILINRQEVSRPGKVTPPEKRGVGLVFQDFALFPHLTICKNVEFGLTELSSRERREYALRLLDRVGLSNQGDSYPNNLSGGEQQRVSLARALAPRPGILLMDEPFSGLDSRMREEVRDETIGLLRDTRSTVLIVTHDPEEAMKIGDRIALMQEGRILQVGTSAQLYDQPKNLFAARFFSELNIFDGQVEGESISWLFGRIPIAEIPGSINQNVKLAVCVRPTDFHVKVAGDVKARRMSDPDETLAITAIVRTRKIVGDNELFEVLVDGMEKAVHLCLRRGDLPDKAREVSIQPRPGKAMVLPVE
jgi:iron(III) transport system ATP-binding protein